MVAICVTLQILLSSACGESQSSIVSVQTGEHPEFIRLSINWPDPVSFDYIRTNTGFEVRFFRRVEFLLDRLNAMFPGSSYKYEGDQTVLTIRVAPNRKFIAKSYGNITYIDIYKARTQEPTPIPHQDLKPTKPIVEKKEEAVKKISEVDLQKLFRKVADYLGELSPDIKSTIVSVGESGLLFKYPDPISVYEFEGKTYVVILKDESPVFEKQLEEKYPIQQVNISGALVVQIIQKPFTRAQVEKHKDGWLVEFTATLPNGKSPQFFERDTDGKIQLSREGLLDPIDVDGVTVFCTQNPDVFAPFEFYHQGVRVLSTSAGAAFKLDAPENMSVSREKIQLSFDGGVLPQEQPKKLKFDSLNLTEPFVKVKESLLSAMAASEESDYNKHIDLILLYLSYSFASEALAEVSTLERPANDKDKGIISLLKGIGAVLTENKDADVHKTLFDLARNDTEAAAWYGFLRALQGNNNSLPAYLENFLALTIEDFPDPLRSLLLLKLVDVLIAQGSIDNAESVYRHISDADFTLDSLSLKQFLNFKIQRLKYGKKNKEEFKRLIQQTANPIIAARLISESEMVDWKKKDHKQYINHLENVVPLLEGNLYQAKAIEYLFNYYNTFKNPFVSLEWAWALKHHYKAAFLNIKADVQKVLQDIIRTDALEKQGLIYALHIFDRFIEELPSSSYITDYVLDLTEKLHKIGLLEESIHLIENYMKREDVKLSLRKQQEMFFQLLDFYIKNENEFKAKDLIQIIEQRGELSKGDTEKTEVFKARLALMKNRSEEALAALQTNHSIEGLKIKSYILWDQKNWSGTAEALEELIDKYGDKFDPERRDRYIVHLAAALVLNEQKYPTKDLGRQKTRVSIQAVTKKYQNVLSKYKELFINLTTEPNNSLQESLTPTIIKKELEETNQLEKMYNELKAVPTN